MIKIAFHPSFVLPLPAGHRFPMEKYELIPAQLLHEGAIKPEQLFEPEICTREILQLTHSTEYIQAVEEGKLSPGEMRKIGLPWSPEMVEREKRIMQGSVDCAMFALQYGVALNVAGGTHHAFADRGEGFCIFNDFAVAANYLLKRKLVDYILILDLDVHQGNGTARIFEGSAHVFTCSIHGRHNYPFHKEKSHLDVALEDGTAGTEYLEILEKTLKNLEELFPDPGVVMYNCGADVLETDRFGKLKLSMEDCRNRDLQVMTWCRKNGFPLVVAMGGGYSEKTGYIVQAQCNTFRTAVALWD